MKAKPSIRIAREVEGRKNRMDRALEGLGKVNINLIEEAFPQGSWDFGIFYDIEFRLPFSFELIESFKSFMEMQYPAQKLQREWRHVWDEHKSAGHFLYYDGFEVSFRTEREGTTCVLNKIGETNKVVSIFEVVCSEGAAEAT